MDPQPSCWKWAGAKNWRILTEEDRRWSLSYICQNSRFIPERSCPLCALQSEESTSVVQGNKYKRLENLRWVGRGKN